MEQSDNLHSKASAGFVWSLFDLFFNQGLQFIVQVILARLLLPEDFGVLAIIMVFIAISNTIIDSGFSQALIREKTVSSDDYKVIFSFNLLVSVILYGVLFISSPFIANFFNNTEITWIIRIVSIVIIFNAFTIIPRVQMIRDINFKSITKISIVANTISSIMAIILALFGFGVWTLVIRTIVAQFLQAVLILFIQKWRPNISFSLKIIKKYISFSYKLLISGLIDTFYNNLFYVVIGKFYSPILLGYYTNAVKLRDTISQSATSAVQKVTYPVLSSINSEGNEELLKSSYKSIIKLAAFLNFPVMLGLAAIAEPLFLIMFGEKWVNSIPYFQLLCIAGMLYPLHALNLNILQVKGRSDLFLFLEVLKKTVGVTLIALSIYLKLGILGLVFTMIIDSFIAYLINTYFSKKTIGYSTLDQVKDVSKSFFVSLGMCIIVLSLLRILLLNDVIELFIGIIVGVGVYGISMKLFRTVEMEYCETLLIKIFKKLNLR